MTSTGADVLDERFPRDPHAAYARLRERGPVRRVVLPDGRRAWLVTRYREAREALADRRLAKDGPGVASAMAEAASGVVPRTLFAAMGTDILDMDAPAHSRLRTLASRAFTTRRVDRLRPKVEAMVGSLLDEMATRGEPDLVADLAAPLPMLVTAELLGLGGRARAEFTGLNRALAGGDAAAVGAMGRLLAEVVARKRADPGDDLFSLLTHTHDEGDRLDDDELVSLGFLLLVAGHESATGLVGNSALALLTHPEQRERVLSDPERLLPPALDELLRFDGPLHAALPRRATEAVEIGGAAIPEGDTVLIGLLAANRDPDRYPDPDRLDLTRPAAGQLAFGHGVHFCLGAPLARMEGLVALGGLFARFPRLALAVPAHELRRRPTSVFHTLERLPVRLGG